MNKLFFIGALLVLVGCDPSFNIGNLTTSQRDELDQTIQRNLGKNDFTIRPTSTSEYTLKSIYLNSSQNRGGAVEDVTLSYAGILKGTGGVDQITFNAHFAIEGSSGFDAKAVFYGINFDKDCTVQSYALKLIYPDHSGFIPFDFGPAFIYLNKHSTTLSDYEGGIIATSAGQYLDEDISTKTLIQAYWSDAGQGFAHLTTELNAKMQGLGISCK
jgi:hypothetical protein